MERGNTNREETKGEAERQFTLGKTVTVLPLSFSFTTKCRVKRGLDLVGLYTGEKDKFRKQEKWNLVQTEGAPWGLCIFSIKHGA